MRLPRHVHRVGLDRQPRRRGHWSTTCRACQQAVMTTDRDARAPPAPGHPGSSWPLTSALRPAPSPFVCTGRTDASAGRASGPEKCSPGMGGRTRQHSGGQGHATGTVLACLRQKSTLPTCMAPSRDFLWRPAPRAGYRSLGTGSRLHCPSLLLSRPVCGFLQRSL